ncbi:MAG: hypothetical protein JWL84_3303 [Rhodospirillales bacterium]|jgi:hypothetical protein|nr:hypothetical protein [Rhodospirillales bacterium]
MAHNHLILNGASRDERRGSLQAALSWVMIVLAILAASLGFTLDHVVRIGL